MGYAKIHHKILTDPKTRKLGGNPFRLFIRLIVWSSREESDGHVPLTEAASMGTARDLRELCEAGLCVSHEGRVTVANYLRHNTSREKIDEKRTRNALRVASYRSTVTAYPSTEYRVQSTENRVQSTEIYIGAHSAPAPKAPKPKPKPKRWTTVPTDWAPNDSHKAKASELGVDISLEAEKFRNWEFKSPKTDPDRTFTIWLTNSSRFSGPRTAQFSALEWAKGGQ